MFTYMGADIPLIYQKELWNTQDNAIVGKIDLCGYRNGNFLIWISAVNDIAAIVLNQKLDTLSSPLNLKREESLISIQIRGEADLEPFKQLLEAIEPMPDSKYQEIKDYYLIFIGKKKLSQPTFHTTYNEVRQRTEHEKQLYKAVKKLDYDKVLQLLSAGVDPNMPPQLGESSLLMYAVHRYLSREYTPYRPTWIKIIQALLDYKADINLKDKFLHETALSLASDWGSKELVDLLMDYKNIMEFAIPNKESAPNLPALDPLETHSERIKSFSPPTKGNNIKTEVSLSRSNSRDILVETEFKRGKDIMHVESFLTTKLPANYIEKLLDLYQLNFSSKEESTPELQRKHFNEKLALDSQEKATIDVIKVNNDIVGFNLNKIYTGEFEGKPYYLAYLSLAYIDKAYRGTRMMSLLSFRWPFALKEAHPDIETYLFYDAIHPNSYRQAWDLLPRYPEYRTEKSLAFVKHITKQIYGEDKAKQYNGIHHFFWPTQSRSENPIDPNKYDKPRVVKKFYEITQGQGGVPVTAPVTKQLSDQLASDIKAKLDTVNFEEHYGQLAEIAFLNQEKKMWYNETECLWPNNPAMQKRH